jgi:hypothetical protein
MPGYAALALFGADLWVWYKTHYVERLAAFNAHKKYTAHGTSVAALATLAFVCPPLVTLLGLGLMAAAHWAFPARVGRERRLVLRSGT